MGEFVRVAALAEVPEGELLAVEAAGRKLCLAHVDGEVYAFADKCSHRDYPLSSGELDAEACTVTCDWHGAAFSLKDGAALTPPATRPVPVYPVELRDGEVWVEVG